jgi:outer membrane protein insertion porin family
LGLSGRAFTDFGTMGGIDIDQDDFPTSPFVGEDDAFRLSVGVGLTWRSPFGPLRLDLAHAILKEDFDKTDLFLFSFGTRF